MEQYECEDAVQTALQQRRPQHIFLAQQHSEGKSTVPAIDFVCLECRDDGPEGNARAFFSAPPPTVVFCANRLHSAREVEETMVHELIHAYDFTVRKMDITKSDILACSEIRSARESECYQKAKLLETVLPNVEFFQKSARWLNARCVREHAVRSTSRTVRFKCFLATPPAETSPLNAMSSAIPPAANTKDPKVRAELYMASHGIKELFEGLGTLLLYHRPPNPREFLIQQLDEMRKAKNEQHHVPFFEENDLKVMFAAFDIKDQGFITTEQYDQALLNLGIEKPTLRLPESVSTINQALFIRSVTQEIKNASTSFM
ncbi:EF-hand calcium-binding domain-containing protein 10 [Phytophthora nicotianae]|uniref:Mitochondrial inner membrane protease ATP23 n=1 Tax=Phytophthora nicotianae TaxID=4792 RepID=A0A0W8CG50_PHYNI|nr:EF-hand calcium-binding domain-containing protein 10 [Phytophthora nicotianae]